MKHASTLLPLFLLAFSGAVSAGKGGAGPAATASPAVGSIITPGSSSILDTPSKDAAGRTAVPGTVGTVQLDATQLAQAAGFMRAAEGVVIEGSRLTLPTTLEDGGAATITLNTDTGELTVRRDKD